MNSGTADQRNRGTFLSRYSRTLLCAILLLAAARAVSAQTIRYGYDDLGRLQWVQDQTGDVAIYVYDPVGNILQIARGAFPDPTAPVGISAFTPAKGAVGTAVTVFGRGFDPAPAQNTVTFSGAPAAVTAASPTQLTAVVPSGASTGPVQVSAPAGTGASAQPFTILVAPVVTPASAALLPKQTFTFAASEPAQWRVNNVVGGNAAVGTITISGLTATYTAPAVVPPGSLVTVAAANQDDFTLQGTATVEILPATDPLRAPPVSVAWAPGFGPGDPFRAVPVSVAPAPVAAPLATHVSVAPAPLAAPLVAHMSVALASTAAPLPAPLVAVAREPVVTSVQPPQLARGSTNQIVVLGGAGFAGATAVTFATLAGSADSTILVNSFTVDSASQITANVSISAGAATGFRVARVTAGGVTSTAHPTVANVLEVLP